MIRPVPAAAGLLAALACGGEPPRMPEGEAGLGEGLPAVAIPAESLVFRGPGSAEVWFTDAREARGPDGQHCVERALEVRRDTLRFRVPLLYTLEAPEPLDDTSMRAVLYNGCAPVAAYGVSYSSGLPRRLPR